MNQVVKAQSGQLRVLAKASALIKLFRGLLRLRREHPAILIGGALLLVMFMLAAFAPYLGTVDPTSVAPAKRNLTPSATAWFGTDSVGRDIYSRTLYGARISLAIGICVASIAAIGGLAVGLVAGFMRRLDGIIMRVVDGIMAIPPILLAIALMALTRSSIWNVIAAISLAEIPRMARLVRGVVLSLRDQNFVEAAITVGTPTPTIIFKHILPNTVSTLMVQATYVCASAMISESILSFIGAGVPPNTPSWGNIIAEGRSLWQIFPHMIAIPAAFLSFTVLAVNMLGDGLRDANAPRRVTRS